MRITAKILAPGLFLLVFLAIGMAVLWSNLTRMESQLIETSQLFSQAEHLSDDLQFLHQQQVTAALRYRLEPLPQTAQALVDTNRETQKVTDQLSVLFEEIGDPVVLTNYLIAQGGAFNLYDSLVRSIDIGDKPLEESTLSRLSNKGRQIQATLDDLRVYYSKKLGSSIRRTEAAKRRDMLMFVGFITVVMVIVAGFSVYQALTIARPIRDLTSVAQRISDGHDELPLAVERQDEIGELGRAFGEMLTRLQGVHNELEARIEERTQELTTEINVRTQVERELRESEERFRTIFEQAAVGVALMETPTGKFARINRRYCDLVGYSPDEMKKMTFQEITHPDDVEADLDNMKRLIAGGIDEFTLEKRYFRKDGSLIWVNLTVSPTWKPGKQANFHIAIVEDITERKKTQAHLIQTSKLATLGEMATGIAHELNQPLNIISMSVETLLERVKDGDASTDDLITKLERIESQTDRAGNITNHLRTFGRDASENFSPVDLKEAVLGAVGLVKEQMRLHDIELHMDLPETCRKVMAHQLQLEQVVLNLLTNASDTIKGQEDGGKKPQRITLKIEDDPEVKEIKLIVQDTGGGIPEEKMDRIFEPFFTTKEIGVGTGLGLSISYGIITDMGGRIEAANVNDGAKFIITLPVTEET